MRHPDFSNRQDLAKQEGCGMVAHERLTEPRVTIEWLLPKRNSLSDLPAFLDVNGIKLGYRLFYQDIAMIK